MEDKLQDFRLIILNDDSLASELKKLNSVEEIYNLYKRVVKEKCLSKDEFHKCIIKIISKNIDEKDLSFVAGGSVLSKKTLASLLAATSVFGVPSVGASTADYSEKSIENNISFSKKVKSFISRNPFKIGAGILGVGSTLTLGMILFFSLKGNNSKQQNSTQNSFQSSPQDTVVTNNPEQTSSESETLIIKPITPKVENSVVETPKIKSVTTETSNQTVEDLFKQKNYSKYKRFSLMNLNTDFSKEEIEVLKGVIPKIHFTIGNLVNIKADAIVNAANPSLGNGGGVTGAIFGFLGSSELTSITSNWKKQHNNGKNLNVGQAAYTSVESIKNDEKFFYKGVIHTVGPNLSGKKASLDTLESNGYMDQLKNCYKESIKLCFDNGLKSVAFPSISTGIFGFPASAAMFCAMQGIMEGVAEKIKENSQNINNIPEIYFVRYKGANAEASESEKEAYDKMAMVLGRKYEDFPMYTGVKN